MPERLVATGWKISMSNHEGCLSKKERRTIEDKAKTWSDSLTGKFVYARTSDSIPSLLPVKTWRNTIDRC